MSDEEFFDEALFAEEVALMDPGPPHIRRRRMTADNDPEQLGSILFAGILDRRLLPALDKERRDELLGVHLARDTSLAELGISSTFNKPAC
jgi:hypothetical protein